MVIYSFYVFDCVLYFFDFSHSEKCLQMHYSGRAGPFLCSLVSQSLGVWVLIISRHLSISLYLLAIFLLSLPLAFNQS